MYTLIICELPCTPLIFSLPLQFFFFFLQTKDAAHLLKPQCHLTGVIVHGRGTYHFISGEEFPHDSNLTIECLQRVFTMLEKEGRLPKKLFVQMDNCSR